MIEWTFYSEKNTGDGNRAAKRAKMGPRRIGVSVAAPTSERIIGRCLGFAKTGERTHTHRPTHAPRSCVITLVQATCSTCCSRAREETLVWYESELPTVCGAPVSDTDTANHVVSEHCVVLCCEGSRRVFL